MTWGDIEGQPPMLSEDQVVGHKIACIFGDSSGSDDSHNFCDFVYQLDAGLAFRMPWAYFAAEAAVEVTELGPRHVPIRWDESKELLLRQNLWSARVTDVMVPEDPLERTPDTGIIRLSSGWYVAQMSSAPHGILPKVNIFPFAKISREMISVWSRKLRFGDG